MYGFPVPKAKQTLLIMPGHKGMLGDAGLGKRRTGSAIAEKSRFSTLGAIAPIIRTLVAPARNDTPCISSYAVGARRLSLFYGNRMMKLL